MSEDQPQPTQPDQEESQELTMPTTAWEWIKAITGLAVGLAVLGVIGLFLLALVFSGGIIEEQGNELASAEWTRGHLNGSRWVEVMEDPDVAWVQKKQVAELVADDMLADPEVRAMPEVRSKGEKTLLELRGHIVDHLLELADK